MLKQYCILDKADKTEVSMSLKNSITKLMPVALIFICCISNIAHAGFITISQSEDIVEREQIFSYQFSPIPKNILGDLIFFVAASGDFSENKVNEHLKLSFDGVNGEFIIDESSVQGSINGFHQNFSSPIAPTIDFIDENFLFSFVVSSELTTLFQSQALVVNASLGSNVNPFYFMGRDGTDPDFVEVGFSYQTIDVPTPTTLGLFGLIIMGLCLRRYSK